jgi:hypothetical protein
MALTVSGEGAALAENTHGGRRSLVIAMSVVCIGALAGGAGYALSRPSAAPPPAPVQEVPPDEPPLEELVPASPSAPAVPTSGSGVFTTASGEGPRFGTQGRFVRYVVQVEEGSGVEPAAFASAVDETLSHTRGWTAAGRWSFQRFSAGPTELTILLASPTTTQRICDSQGLFTRGETSCRVGRNAVINLKRWQLAVPWYSGKVREYQHMVVNHEVGHFLGFGHVTCPGAGQLAPVMQRQTYGMQGCTTNPWPYPSGMTLWSGPPAPN